jgi:polyhydroxybutyrate depolymerase
MKKIGKILLFGLILILLPACSRSFATTPVPAYDGFGAAVTPAEAGALGAPAARPCVPGVTDEYILSGGQTRLYRLVVPQSYKAGTPTPLLLGFHGAGSNAAHFEAYSGFDAQAERFGFIVAYPQGLGELSNWDTLPDSTDVPFVRDLINALAARCSLDLNRVYATGHSRGGGMVNRLACELSDRIAAIGPVSGDYENSETCAPLRPVPVVAFHGTADPTIPYNGFGVPGEIHETYTRIGTPIPAWASAWAGRNGCSSASTRIFQFGPVTGEGWGQCRAGADVVLYTIQDGTHDWPTAIDAAQMLWDFFSHHPLASG